MHFAYINIVETDRQADRHHKDTCMGSRVFHVHHKDAFISFNKLGDLSYYVYDEDCLAACVLCTHECELRQMP